MKLSQEALLSLVVYSSFCNTFAGEVDINPVSIVIIALVIFVVQFGLFALAWWFYNIPALGFDTKDAIAGMFCSVHKTMALGVPVISSMYEDSPAGSGVYSIPLLIYHLLAVSGSILVPIMKRKVAETEASKEGDQKAKVDLENGLDGSQPSAGASVKPVHATYGVLGATGNVGKHVVACLKQSMKEANNGETLVVFSRTGTPSDGDDDASIISGSVDMSSPSSIKNALRKYRVQVLFVAMPQALASAQMVACGTAITEGLLPLPGVLLEASIRTPSWSGYLPTESSPVNLCLVVRGRLGWPILRPRLSLRTRAYVMCLCDRCHSSRTSRSTICLP